MGYFYSEGNRKKPMIYSEMYVYKVAFLSKKTHQCGTCH